MDENFSLHNRHGSAPGFQTTTIPLSATDTNSLYSPMSVESKGSVGSAMVVEDTKGVFDFKPLPIPKTSVTKSV